MTMKTTLLILVVAAFGIAGALSHPQKRDVSSMSSTDTVVDLAKALGDTYTAVKRIMPCGDTKMGIPVLEPMRFPLVSYNINQELLVLNGTIKNLVLSGLSNFIIIELNGNSTNNRLSTDFLFRDVQALGEYNLYINADLAGYKFVVNLVGLMNLGIKDLRTNGGITIGTNSDGGIILSDVEMYVEVGDIVSHILNPQWSVDLNNFFNKYVHDAALLWLQTRREFLMQLYSNYLTNVLNPVLSKLSISDCVEGLDNLIQQWNAVTCNA